MTSSQFNRNIITDIVDSQSPASIYPLAFGYLTEWLEQECKRTNNGQISAAETRARIQYLREAIQLAHKNFAAAAKL